MTSSEIITEEIPSIPIPIEIIPSGKIPKNPNKRRKRINFFIVLFLLLLVAGILVWQIWQAKELRMVDAYDRLYRQTPITTIAQVDNTMRHFKQVGFKDLDSAYLAHSKYNTKRYKKLAKDKQFYVVTGQDVFKYVAGTFRVRDLMPKDRFYKDHIKEYPEDGELYWLLDKKVLYKLVELQNALKKKGLDKNAFVIKSGFRHPQHNEKIKGAKKSSHMKGQAIDISVGDVNRDGKTNKKDKKLVLDILEKEVIKNSGGIGRYPGTMSIHFDVRGYRARWDKY